MLKKLSPNKVDIEILYRIDKSLQAINNNAKYAPKKVYHIGLLTISKTNITEVFEMLVLFFQTSNEVVHIHEEYDFIPM